MNQSFLERTKESSEEDKLRDEFLAIKEKPIEQASTRIVNFKVYEDCACGIGEYSRYHAEVPVDSPIQNGDRLDDFPEDAANIEDGWV